MTSLGGSLQQQVGRSVRLGRSRSGRADDDDLVVGQVRALGAAARREKQGRAGNEGRKVKERSWRAEEAE